MLDIQDALSLLEKRESRDAARLLEQMVAELPAYATAHVLLARSYEALNDWDRAVAIWREALHIIPNSPVVRSGLQRAIARPGRRSRGRTEEESASSRGFASADPQADEGSRPPLRDVSPLRAQDVSLPTHIPASSRPEPSPAPSTPPAPSPPPASSPRREPTSPPASSLPGDAPDDLSELKDIEDTGTPHYEDLDRLINELESARIVPRPDLENVPSPDLDDDIEDVVSETLARIYASQGQYDEAARVYELLAGQHPEEADEYLQKASKMRSRASDDE